MGKSRATFICALAVSLILAVPVLTRGQEFSDAGQKFWTKYKQAKELNDGKEIARLIRRGKTEAIEVFETLILYFCSPGYEGFAEQTKALVEDLETVLKTKQFSYRFDLVLQCSREDRVKWLTAWNGDIDGFATYLEGKETENVYKLDESLQKHKKSLVDFVALKDDDLIAKVNMHLAMCSAALGEHYESCVYYKKALDIMQALPFDHPDLKFVEAGYNQYITKGYDPTKPKDEGGEPPPEEEGGTAAGGDVEGGEREFKKAEFTPGEITDSCTLKYTLMKSPDEFITPAFNTGYNPYLWPSSWFDAAQNEMAKFAPYFGYILTFYGKQINICRANNKFYFDIDGNEKTRVEIRSVTKPYKLTFTDTEKGPDGKASKYQIFAQATGQQEVMFNIEQNNAPETVEAISLRVRTGCYTKGKILGENVVLIDDNTSGIFGDPPYPVESDYITYGQYPHYRPDAMVIGREKIARPFSKIMRLEDKFYELTVDKFGRNLDAKEVTVETGTLKFVYNGDMEPVYIILRLIDENNPGVFFNVADSKNPVILPIGEYEIACGKIEEKKKKSARQIRIYHGKADYIKVWPGEETVLEMGEPFTYTFETRYVAKNFIVEGKSVNVWGKSGELYTQFFDIVPQPTLSLRDKKTGKLLLKGEKMRRAERDDFYKDRYCCWHPLDFTYEIRRGMEVEAMLETKSVKMLGGPIKSEWH